MNKERLVEYIEAGLSSGLAKMKEMLYGPGIFTFVGFYFGYVAKRIMPVSITMSALYLVTVLAGSVLYKRKDSVGNRLLIYALVFSNWFVQLSLLAVIVLLLQDRFYFSFLLVLIFPLVLPSAACVYMSRKIHSKKIEKQNKHRTKKGHRSKKKNLPPQKVPKSVWIASGCYGLLGVCLARVLGRDLGQRDIVTVLVVCFLFMNCLFSAGLIVYQKLYYLYKYTKSGLLNDDDFTIEL